ncbi:hypothetical protein SLEP1_g36251 [Rubroshorea leprosula]|uniref:Uncharacterized protein n=1 Tax=Rubroshorea leprosula TaxID=152421 RepID=A0AAV5KR81_9ROSI|nr:hypothetical protein SLEP1_g36251 [Rubroshorea leprosula]
MGQQGRECKKQHIKREREQGEQEARTFYCCSTTSKGKMFNYRRLRANRESSRNEESPRQGMGGIITVIVILVNEALQTAATNGLLYNMVIYLMMDYHMTAAKAENIVFYWNAATGIVAILWAPITDSHLGRFSTISIASACSLLVKYYFLSSFLK